MFLQHNKRDGLRTLSYALGKIRGISFGLILGTT